MARRGLHGDPAQLREGLHAGPATEAPVARGLHSAFSDDDETLNGYIQHQRLSASLRDLIDPANAGRSITDITLAAGFGNLSHFSRVFREHTGGSPSEFRRQAAVR